MKRYLSEIKSKHVQICLLILLLLGILTVMPIAIAAPNTSDVAVINSIIKNNNLGYKDGDVYNWDFIEWSQIGGEHRIVYLDLSGKNLTGNMNVSGLRYLEALNCSNNRLTSLTLPATLEVLDCSNNRLTSLGTLPTSLTFLDCNNNQLKNLGGLPSGLTYLDCKNNQLGGLGNLPGKLELLDCSNNNLTSLQALPNGLKYLSCSNNQLSNLGSLPGTLPGTLPNTLVYLICDNNQLTNLGKLPAGLLYLDCYNNKLTELGTLPSKLETLDCSNNQLTKLNIGGIPIKVLAVAGNPIQEFTSPDSRVLRITTTGTVLGKPGNQDPWTAKNYGYNLTTKIITLTAVPDSGKTFVRWEFSPTVTLKTGTPSDKEISFTLDKNITVTPITNTTANTYTITFNSDGGTSVQSQTVNSGSTVSKPSNPIKSGYTFVEWRLNGAAYNFSAPVNSNLNLVAFYRANTTTTYTVTFNSDGGTSVPSQNVNSGNLVSKPANPSKTGYTFVEWRLNGAAYNFSAPVNSNLTLVAVYQAVGTATYTVTFNANGGMMYDLSKTKVKSGGLVTKPDDPFKLNGDTFVEWQLNGVAYNFSTPVTSNITLVAVYKINGTTTYTVTFNSDGGTSVPSQNINSGSPVAKPANPSKAGYTFVEWRLNGAAYNFSAPVNSNLNLVAFYRANTTTTYTVTFNGNGGMMYDLPSSIKVSNGGLVTKPYINPSKSNNNFIEWQLNGVAYNFSTPVTSNLTLVAFYDSIHTVTFNANGGMMYDLSKVKVNNGSLVTKPDDPFKPSGGTFVEWQLNGTAYNFGTPVTSNVTLVAVYK